MSWDSEQYQVTLFQDQPIPKRTSPPRSRLPKPLRAAKTLAAELRAKRRSREEVFLAQGKLLADWEPEEVTLPPVNRSRVGVYGTFYVTYESMNDRELECYFVWRTAVRNRDIQGGSASCVFLYVYELINQIGVSDPEDGFRRLLEIARWEGLESRVEYFLNRWIQDYLVYYNLPPALLGREQPGDIYERIKTVFRGPEEERMEAVVELSSYRLDRSRFYRGAKPLFDRVALGVLDRVREYYEKHRKMTVEQDYFGLNCYSSPARLFESAVFLPRGRQPDRTYELDPMTIYRCQNGRWTVDRVHVFAERSETLGKLMKTVDCALRQALSDPHPLKPVLSTKWILAIVEQEVSRAQEEMAREQEEERRRPSFDLTQLSRIRSEAAETRDKLLTESEQDTEPMAPEPEKPAAPQPQEVPAAGDTPLTPEEYRYLHCLLYHGDIGWVSASGLLVSVLTDHINETLFDDFGDTVLDESGALIEDYIDDLKEMIRP